MALKETQEKLKQWGMWLRGGTGLGYGQNILGTIHGGGLPTAPISDDHAMSIDKAVAVLKQTNYSQYRCIKLSYVDQKSNRAIERETDISYRVVQRLIEAGEQWLDDAFNELKII
ncbi:MAG: Phage antitermination protein [Verrucomicrobiaceae bacterium]|nr:Phage antitermination protein [Verrucomicrobiaceae bacterium]